ncbi:class I SAM-dependent methyltransferase [Candidatus Woesearchaeota archaeon]|nr:class I SAM-dependent methyltransferase [Candidatus Woesearchaeota archaeon]
MKGDWSDEFVHHWEYYTGPARASKKDLEIIKSKIKLVGKECKVLILGATPEYRNLCGELKVQIACLDFSRYNFEYLKQEVTAKPHEKLVEGNWLQTVLDEKFDIILADNVINLVQREGINILLKNVQKMLKPHGIFMPRIYIRKEHETINEEQVIKEYRKKGSKKPLYNYIGRNLYLTVYNTENERVMLKNVYNAAEKLFQKGIITKEEFAFFEKAGMKDREFTFYMPTEKDIESAMKKYFDIINTCYNAEVDPELYPLYILKLK